MAVSDDRPFGEGVAVVTGASSGLGAEFARQLSRRGRPVLAIARRQDRLEALARETRGTDQGAIHPLPVDLTAPESAQRVADAARRLGPVDWLVHSAGVVRFGPFAGTDRRAHLDQVDVNCVAMVRLTDALLPAMVDRGRGVILNIGSLSGFQPTPGFAVYGASKAFVLSFSEALREELRGTGVQVSMLCTPPVRNTEMLARGVPQGVSHDVKMFLEIPPEKCVRAAIAGAERGRTLVFVHARDRIMPVMVKLSPRAVVRQVSRLIDLWYLGLPPLKRLPPWRDTTGVPDGPAAADRIEDR
jgi:short-subunit dehydrogenase